MQNTIKIKTISLKQFSQLENGLYQCNQCSISKTKKGISTHFWRVHGKGQEHKPINCNYVAWNKGLTAKNNLSIAKGRKTLIEGYRSGRIIPHKSKHSEEFRKVLSERQSLHNSGGKCKWFYVNGVPVQGTWEYKLALYFEQKNIKWQKPKVNRDLFKYKMNGKERSYAPDFYLPQYDCYLEVKGYWWGNDKEKMKCVISQYPDRKILIIMKKEFDQILLDKFNFAR